jgi:predicted nucleic acid-binding protein
MTPILVDSSAVVSAVLERGLSPKALRAIAASPALVVSRLALVETGRALYRAHNEKRISAAGLMRVQGEVEELWARCELWEITRAVCKEATMIAPSSALRTLDALHLATLLALRKRLPSAKLLTMDVRMADAAKSLGLKLVET